MLVVEDDPSVATSIEILLKSKHYAVTVVDNVGEGVRHAFETMGKIRQYADAGGSNRKWNDTLALVETNKAAFMIAGDWAKGDFSAAGMTPGKEYCCLLAPDTQDAYVMTVDVFAFPKVNKPDQVAAQRKLAELMMDPAVQVEFNKYKGSLPARLDADPARHRHRRPAGRRPPGTPRMRPDRWLAASFQQRVPREAACAGDHRAGILGEGAAR